MSADNKHSVFEIEGCFSVEQIKAYSKGSLREVDSYALEKHLVGCELCNEIFDSINEIDLNELNTLNNNVRQRVRDRINESKRRGAGFYLSRYGAAAVVVLLIGLSVFWIDQYTEKPAQEIAQNLPSDVEKPKKDNDKEVQEEMQQPEQDIADAIVLESEEELSERGPAQSKPINPSTYSRSVEIVEDEVEEDFIASGDKFANEEIEISEEEEQFFDEDNNAPSKAPVVLHKKQALKDAQKSKDDAAGKELGDQIDKLVEETDELEFVRTEPKREEAERDKINTPKPSSSSQKRKAKESSTGNEPTTEDIVASDPEPESDFVEVPEEILEEPLEDEEKVSEPYYFTIVEDMPEFPGGMIAFQKYIQDSLIYPDVAKEAGVEGKVYVQFIVNEDGSISDEKVVRGVSKLIDNEALRVVKAMPNWKPGKQRGKPVKVQFTIPLYFRLK